MILELLVAIAAVWLMAKIASADGQSTIVWGGITFALVVACQYIPLPYVRILIAVATAFAAMTAYKMVADK